MKNPEIKSLPIGIRVFPAPAALDGNTRSKKAWRQPEGMLVIHTVARSDATQKLLMGSYQLIVGGHTLEEGFFLREPIETRPPSTDGLRGESFRKEW